jgi:hypothetical protein
VYHDEVTHDYREKWRDRVRKCDGLVILIGAYNSRREEGNGEHGADDMANDLR